MAMECCPTDQDPAKGEASVDNRLEAMKARLLALPSQIVLHPDDLRRHLEHLESLDGPTLAREAERIIARGYMYQI